MIGVSTSDRKEFDKARRDIARLEHVNSVAIKVLTAEQALLAQRVVREAGRNG